MGCPRKRNLRADRLEVRPLGFRCQLDLSLAHGSPPHLQKNESIVISGSTPGEFEDGY